MSETKERLYEVKLTAAELRQLDGTCSPTTQGIVNKMLSEAGLAIIYNVPAHIAAMVQSIITIAKAKGKIEYRVQQAARCPCCDRREGYYNYSRTTYHKIFGNRYPNHVKGQPDYNSPKRFTVYDLGRSCVTNTVFTGYCEQCKPIIEPVLKAELIKVDYAHPMLYGKPVWLDLSTRFKHYDRRKCKDCGWEGGENLMRRRPTMMGDGDYPAGCPKCPAVSLFFGRNPFENAPGYVLVPVEGGEPIEVTTKC